MQAPRWLKPLRNFLSMYAKKEQFGEGAKTFTPSGDRRRDQGRSEKRTSWWSC